MRVLITGAYGFVGQHIASGLLQAGHDVVACGRNVELGRRLLPGVRWLRCDFNSDVTEESWLPRLEGVDAVVNCVGILQSTARDSHDRIHSAAPIALFRAAKARGVRRVVQISALGAEPDTGTLYSDSKSEADTFLKGLDLDWIILKPSLLYARGSYGGTTLIRALAGLPALVPLIDGGGYRFQPVAMDYLVQVVIRLIALDAPSRLELAVTGPEPRTLKDVVLLTRRWLGFPEAPVLAVPASAAKPMLWLGDIAGWFGLSTSLRSTALRQMELGNTASPEATVAATGIVPRKMEDELARNPSTLQDRLHARSTFAVAALRITLGLFWTATGLITLVPSTNAIAASFLGATGLPDGLAHIVVNAGATTDIVLGMPFLIGWKVRVVGLTQLAVSFLYLMVLSFSLPLLWLDPFGPLLKVLPIMAATLIVMAWAEPR